jgi:lysophospholipase L1-like esterase
MPRLRIGSREVYPSYIDNRTDRYLFNLGHTVDSFCIVLPCREGDMFSVTGILLDNRQAGFSYHSIGVNGASVPDYLRCRHFVRDLRLLHPDVVIFGIGINDAVPTNFDTAAFRRNYLQLIDSVRAVNPECAFIFVTNNDSFRRLRRNRYEVNRNGFLAREVFYRLARDVDGAVWDQFAIMGGLRSMDRWRQAKLAQTDRVHFTPAGYRLVGNLLADALLQQLNTYTHRADPSR